MLLLALAVIGAIPAAAADVSSTMKVSATMQVSAFVIARAIVTVDGQVSTVSVSDADVARGYVDVADPILVRVRTNSRQGYVLTVTNLGGQFSSIELSSNDVSISVRPESFLQRPYVSGGDVMPMRARLHLAPDTMPGQVPVAIAFNATPL
jgi:hypothetical protein